MERPATRAQAPGHLDHLDGWRGLAITFLLIGHFAPVPGINLGSVGVDLFFVLSGYLMGQLLFVKQTAIPLFYRRRISRILPAHVVFLVATTAFYVALGLGVDWRQTIAALCFVNNYVGPEPGQPEMPFGHIWSLSVEEHSYVLLSVVAIAARRRWLDARWAILTFAGLFSLAGWLYWSRYSGRKLDFEFWLHTEVAAYGIFISAGLLTLLTGRSIPRLPAPAYVAMLGAGILLHWWSVPNPIKTTLGVGAMALTINLLDNAPKVVKAALSIAPLRRLGVWSFSIYIWQQPFYLWMHRSEQPTLLALAAAFACGLASYYLVERPVRAYLNANWRRADAAATAISASGGLPRPARPSGD